MDDYPGDGSEMTGPGIGNEKRGMARTFPRFSLPGAHRLAAKYEFLILEVEAAELNLESTDALPLVASGRAPRYDGPSLPAHNLRNDGPQRQNKKLSNTSDFNVFAPAG